MKTSAQVVVIGGGVVGASVLYHLAEAGWTDLVLLERKELTSGSTWHAAGGMHTLNGDPNVSKLQQYTIELYKEIEAQFNAPVAGVLPLSFDMADNASSDLFSLRYPDHEWSKGLRSVAEAILAVK